MEVLAKRVGIAPTTLYDLERGDSKSTTKLPQLAHEIGVRALWLETGEGPKYPVSRSGDATQYLSARPPARLAVRESGTDDLLELPILEFGLAMGDGQALHDFNPVIDTMTVNLPLLRQLASFTHPSKLQLTTGFGDSMHPTFADGDPLIVDTGVTDVKLDAIYAFYLNDHGYIKRLQRRPDGSMLMISDNKSYEPYLITNGDREKFRMVGRVLLAWNAKRL